MLSKFILISILLVSCNGSENQANPNQRSFNGVDLIEYSKSYLGVPHRFGGTTKKGMDCSGFVQICYNKFGINLPHSANDQATLGKKINGAENLIIGDVVFFKNTYTTAKFITHSGIYLGNQEFIHVSTKKGVIISKLNDPYYWKERFVYGIRLIMEPES